MPAMHRFYAPQLSASETIDLSGGEATHLARVLRLSSGDRVSLFDGQGREALAELVEVRRKTARLRVVERLPANEPVGPPVTLITAVPKADRFRWLIEKATELGVRRIVPVRTERSVVHPGGGKLHKMQAAVIAACKQSGRNDLMVVDELCEWPDAIASIGGGTLLVAHPSGRPIHEVQLPSGPTGQVGLAIGPEGGLTPSEMALAKEVGGEVVHLGPVILRTETAGLVMAAWVRLASLTSCDLPKGSSS